MSEPGFIVTGTDTGIGKTVAAAALVALLGARYWKPVQSGLEEETDSEAVLRLAGTGPSDILPEAYRLQLPASPHISAAAEGIEIDPAKLHAPPASSDGRPLIIEGAGGLLVPLTFDTLLIDVFAHWRRPIVLCARTALGTINHTLLSVEALRTRRLPLAGILFIGDDEPEVRATIAAFGRTRDLGRLPRLDPLTPSSLMSAARDSLAQSLTGETP